MTTQAHIYYSGMVQGVGFRFTVQDIARSMRLNGWVKNLPDGRVQVVVEGQEQDIRDLLAKIQQHFESYIKDVQIQYGPPSEPHRGFDILR